ncbi:MAG: bifunctional hydroxymethylpyrimidine kinase/phosphomethylpyrimidine kinase [Akkermansiaceae bacterium]|nr:bifunctional hydroxymethylpyrimidine kinase/phosphomethylpyrimidine kinase [Akkermansiaceae bacterium]NNM28726.1 bifunctional hydroxymethylpyrimidine kinase/phosphomethylpyrimidine kinase [Akkermansiaceae bacterium]
MSPAPPVALTIAGSDCSAGAGLQADLKTFSCFGVHGLTAVTAVVAETANAVHGIYPVEPAALQEQVQLLLAAYPVAAIKTGMLGSKRHVVAVAELLSRVDIPLVVDPVMVASTGDPLVPDDAVEAYRDRLLPLARVMTPNLPEAEALLGSDRGDAESMAGELAGRFGSAVFLTGGHADGAGEAIDFLAEDGAVRRFAGPWIEVPGSHGSGCTISAAITAGLARGRDLAGAVAEAKKFIGRALEDSYEWSAGERPAIHALNQLCRGDGREVAAKGCGRPNT